MEERLDDLRWDYGAKRLRRDDLPKEPLTLFNAWMADALRIEEREPNAMALATATADGRPSCRIVLLKDVSARGFVFYTCYTSRKGREIESTRRAAGTFWWARTERQVRVEGAVERVEEEVSDAYFDTRPLDARLAAAVSPQSDPVDSRERLEAQIELLRSAHPDGDVPRPETWGGYRLVPDHIEFWQGGPSRLHDRYAYDLDDGDWSITRLGP